ncbi:hypothetical protein [Roseivirga sp.]|nr:hypothetical protein [Roseivirga sp.]
MTQFKEKDDFTLYLQPNPEKVWAFFVHGSGDNKVSQLILLSD